jgi:hypothetical protein
MKCIDALECMSLEPPLGQFTPFQFTKEIEGPSPMMPWQTTMLAMLVTFSPVDMSRQGQAVPHLLEAL